MQSLVRDFTLSAAFISVVAMPAAAFAPCSRLPTLRAVRTAQCPLVVRADSSSDQDAVAARSARRHFLQLGALAVVSAGAYVEPASAKRANAPVKQLLDDDGNPETPEERKARFKEARKKSDEARKAADEKAKQFEAENGVANVEMGSNLRGDYYFPTARKRYLPRVKRAYDELVKVEDAPDEGDWGKLEAFAKGPGDVGSALKLYASALGGGGLSIGAKFMDKMKGHGETYDSTFKSLQAAIKAKDAAKASSTLGELKSALLAYRYRAHDERPSFASLALANRTRARILLPTSTPHISPRIAIQYMWQREHTRKRERGHTAQTEL